MNYKEIEPKWQKEWDKLNLSCVDKARMDKKYYVLEMFSYPSGANLHLGHVYNFAPSDTFARFKKMQGYAVFQPMGFDAFGLPAENYAIKTGVHPKDSTDKNIEKMRCQLRELGAMYDWSNEVVTCDPEYYRWTQWLFLQFYRSGLAYRKDAPVNWCTSCNTVIANEQAEGGVCERCGCEVLKKNMTQWFFKITGYAEELLSGLDTIDWPEKTKAMQRNWIGKSTGAELIFPLKKKGGGHDLCDAISVFTTRPDTLLGVSYVVLAPEHPLVPLLTAKECHEIVKDYQYRASKLSDVERMSERGEKTGVFTGGYCFHPVTNEKLPVWIADYCLSTYGTGAVMGVPAHDTRDFDFAQKYDLPIKRVIDVDPAKTDLDGKLPFVEYGVLVNSGQFDGLSSENAKTKITDFLSKKGLGKAKINYRLRDWSVSRQRYWGCPIPIIHCEKCGAVPVPDKDLPVTLPYNVNFTPDGKSPLGKNEEFMSAVCPACGGAARRESDTLDTFICSSWYFLRYPDAHNQKAAFDKDLINKMLPVDKYIGGPEHACMHLLYSRFFTKALRDMGYLNFDEPFKSLVHQGMILGPDGEKMSKNKGNIVNPDKYYDEYGSDVLRMYLMFAFSYIDGGPWSDDGIKSMARFLDRAERIIDTALQPAATRADKMETDDDAELLYALNYCIKSVTQDLEVFSFNTAVARLMELVNAMYKYSALDFDPPLFREIACTFIRLIAPFAPHFAEELNRRAGVKAASVFELPYPVFDESKLQRNQVEIAMQINSKIVGKIMINPAWSDDEITAKALSDAKIESILQGRGIKKAIVIKQRLINLIV